MPGRQAPHFSHWSECILLWTFNPMGKFYLQRIAGAARVVPVRIPWNKAIYGMFTRPI